MEYYNNLEAFETDLQTVCVEATNNLPLYSSEAEYQLAVYRELHSLKYEVYMETVSLKRYKGVVFDHGKNDRLDLTVRIDDVMIILELKSVDAIKDKQRYQLMSYLQSCSKNTPGYLINFHEKTGTVQIEKLIYRIDQPILNKWTFHKSEDTIVHFRGEVDSSETKNELTKNDLLHICKLCNIPNTSSGAKKADLIMLIKSFLHQNKN